MNPRVDVITPVYNTPLGFVREALESLRAQTVSSWVVWVIDDGSAPDYARALQSLLAEFNDPRLQYLAVEHAGPSGSRNRGLERGSAPYVAFLDSDDAWLPTHLDRQLSLLDAQPGFTLVHGHSEIIDEHSQITARPAAVKGLNTLDAAQCFERMARSNFINASSVVTRRNLLEQVKFFDPSFPCLVDKELWMRMLAAGARFHHDETVVLRYRVHSGNISKKTDLLLATRLRVVELAERLIRTTPAYSGIDWPRLKRDMLQHLHTEAAHGFFGLKRYADAAHHASPSKAGWHWGTLKLWCKAVARR
jgi:glycosyltransferase involved in cell wall biosynthesis